MVKIGFLLLLMLVYAQDANLRCVDSVPTQFALYVIATLLLLG